MISAGWRTGSTTRHGTPAEQLSRLPIVDGLAGSELVPSSGRSRPAAMLAANALVHRGRVRIKTDYLRREWTHPGMLPDLARSHNATPARVNMLQKTGFVEMQR